MIFCAKPEMRRDGMGLVRIGVVLFLDRGRSGKAENAIFGRFLRGLTDVNVL